MERDKRGKRLLSSSEQKREEEEEESSFSFFTLFFFLFFRWNSVVPEAFSLKGKRTEKSFSFQLESD